MNHKKIEKFSELINIKYYQNGSRNKERMVRKQ